MLHVNSTFQNSMCCTIFWQHPNNRINWGWTCQVTSRSLALIWEVSNSSQEGTMWNWSYKYHPPRLSYQCIWQKTRGQSRMPLSQNPNRNFKHFFSCSTSTTVFLPRKVTVTETLHFLLDKEFHESGLATMQMPSRRSRSYWRLTPSLSTTMNRGHWSLPVMHCTALQCQHHS